MYSAPPFSHSAVRDGGERSEGRKETESSLVAVMTFDMRFSVGTAGDMAVGKTTVAARAAGLDVGGPYGPTIGVSSVVARQCAPPMRATPCGTKERGRCLFVYFLHTGVDYFHLNVDVDGKHVRLQVFDTAGASHCSQSIQTFLVAICDI